MSSSHLPAFVPSFSCSEGITPENIEVLRIHAASDVEAAIERMQYVIEDAHASAEQVINAAYLLSAARALVQILHIPDPQKFASEVSIHYATADGAASAAERAAAAFVLNQTRTR